MKFLSTQQARAESALTRMRREAAMRGLEKMPSAAIEAQIRAVRSKRKRKVRQP